MKILHLDLSKLYRSVIEKACQKVGVTYIGVQNASEALHLITEEHPDAVLTSLGLEMDPKDFMLKLERQAGSVFTPVFLLSSEDGIPDSKVLFESGVVGFFSKKQSPDEILSAIIRFLEPEEHFLDKSDFSVALVEDSPLERKLIVGYLNRMSILMVEQFADAQSLLDSDLDFDLFLIDYVLESEDANGLIFEIRHKFPEAAILVVSGVSQEEVIVRALNLGADDYIQKPFGLDLFRARINAHLRNIKLIRQIEEGRRSILQVHKNLLAGIEIARELQIGWIPTRFPDDEWICADGVYEPMDELGGDFYDYYKQDEKHYYFLMTDVSGHGVSSALITSMLKLVFQNNAQTIAGPDLMMMTLNRGLYHSIGDRGYFVTSVCLYLDLGEKQLSLACAGHPDILWQQGTKIRRLPGGQRDRILGITPTVLYQRWNEDFLPGDRFFLYTDGVIETANEEDELFEIERLEELLIQNRETPVGELKFILLKTLENFRGRNRQNDDITFVVIEIPLNDS